MVPKPQKGNANCTSKESIIEEDSGLFEGFKAEDDRLEVVRKPLLQGKAAAAG